MDRWSSWAAGVAAAVLVGVLVWLLLGQPDILPGTPPRGDSPSTGDTPAGSAADQEDISDTGTQEPAQETKDEAPEEAAGDTAEDGSGNDGAEDPAEAAAEPVTYRLEPVVDGLRQPLQFTHAGDGSGRMFAVEQPGRLLVVEDGQVRQRPFLDLSDAVNASGGEQGLLSVAFHPDFSDNGHLFVNYTRSDGATVVARYTVADSGGVEPDSRRLILTVDQPYSNHNGGLLRFGPEGYLYIGLGDGGSGGDPHGNGQNIDTLLGSLLRIDVDERTGDRNYGIPSDNPFAGGPGRDEIWAYGLRNPWRFSFDGRTGDLYIADVGQNEIEEINLEPAGGTGGVNYGWNLYEGKERYSSGQPRGEPVFPVAQYAHGDTHCSVTGGGVYRGEALPALRGSYFYGDWCSGQIWRLQRTDGGFKVQPFMDTEFNITAFGRDPEGELYVVDQGGAIYRLTAAQQGQ